MEFISHSSPKQLAEAAKKHGVVYKEYKNNYYEARGEINAVNRFIDEVDGITLEEKKPKLKPKKEPKVPTLTWEERDYQPAAEGKRQYFAKVPDGEYCITPILSATQEHRGYLVRFKALNGSWFDLSKDGTANSLFNDVDYCQHPNDGKRRCRVHHESKGK